MLPEAKQRARAGATMVVFLTHGALAILAVLNLLAYTVPPEYEFLAIAATNPIWVALHSGVAIVGVAAFLLYREAMFEIVAASAGVLGAWALINLMWGLNPVRPVSLAGPVLALGMALASYFLARLWMSPSGEHRKRD